MDRRAFPTPRRGEAVTSTASCVSQPLQPARRYGSKPMKYSKRVLKVGRAEVFRIRVVVVAIPHSGVLTRVVRPKCVSLLANFPTADRLSA